MKLARILSLIITLSLALSIAILYPLELISDKAFKGIVAGLAASFILSEALEWKEYRSEVKETLKNNLNDSKSDFLREIRSIIDSTGAVDTLRFKNSKETYEYLTEKLNTAKTSIIDVTLGPKIYTQLKDIPEHRINFVEAKKNILAKNEINYKHIAVVNEIGRLKRIKEELDKSKKYFVGILNSENNIPKLSFYIIDGKEVIIGGLKMYDKTTTSQDIKTSNRVIVDLFIEYFNLIWKSDYCETIEDEKTKNEIITKLEAELNNANQSSK